MTAKQARTASAEPVRNEAAERLPSGNELREWLFLNLDADLAQEGDVLLGKALAAERRATVERIRTAIDAGPIARYEEDPEDEGDVSYGRVIRILDEVLDAGPYWGNNGGTGDAILDEEAAR